MEKVLDVKNLTVSFKTDNGLVRAVRGVSFDLHKGETLCIVGESGSGKSVTSKAIMGILANNAVVDDGEIIYEGENILNLSEDAFHKIRGKKIGMIFQDPLSSLNPIVRIGKQITEATLVNGNKLKKLFDDICVVEQTAVNKCISNNAAIVKQINKDVLKAVEQRTIKSEELIAAEDELMEMNDYLEDISGNEITESQKESLITLTKKVDDLMKQRNNEISVVTKEETLKAKPLLVAENLRFKEELNLLTVDLKAKQKIAKVEVKEYKTKVVNEWKQKYAGLKAEFAAASDERKTELTQIIREEKEIFENKLRVTKAKAKEEALQIMREVGIPQPEQRFNQFPFEFSGGMRQRIVIAIALTANPDILICDEPTTALDVTIQAQILDLINKLKVERKLSCVFITHDLGVVANMADRVAVMYAGKIVEYGEVNEIFYEPKHPYTWALLSSVPDVDSAERLDAIPGTPPNMIYPPKGDAFALRSKYAMNIDFKEQPPYFKVSDTHYAATWLLHESAPKVEMPKIVSERIKKSTEGVSNNGK